MLQRLIKITLVAVFSMTFALAANAELVITVGGGAIQQGATPKNIHDPIDCQKFSSASSAQDLKGLADCVQALSLQGAIVDFERNCDTFATPGGAVHCDPVISRILEWAPTDPTSSSTTTPMLQLKSLPATPQDLTKPTSSGFKLF